MWRKCGVFGASRMFDSLVLLRLDRRAHSFVSCIRLPSIEIESSLCAQRVLGSYFRFTSRMRLGLEEKRNPPPQPHFRFILICPSVLVNNVVVSFHYVTFYHIHLTKRVQLSSMTVGTLGATEGGSPNPAGTSRQPPTAHEPLVRASQAFQAIRFS